jgi:hypothetical protein
LHYLTALPVMPFSSMLLPLLLQQTTISIKIVVDWQHAKENVHVFVFVVLLRKSTIA